MSISVSIDFSRNMLVYDEYELDAWESNEGDKEELQEKYIQKIDNHEYSILEP